MRTVEPNGMASSPRASEIASFDPLLASPCDPTAQIRRFLGVSRRLCRSSAARKCLRPLTHSVLIGQEHTLGVTNLRKRPAPKAHADESNGAARTVMSEDERATTSLLAKPRLNPSSTPTVLRSVFEHAVADDGGRAAAASFALFGSRPERLDESDASGARNLSEVVLEAQRLVQELWPEPVGAKFLRREGAAGAWRETREELRDATRLASKRFARKRAASSLRRTAEERRARRTTEDDT